LQSQELLHLKGQIVDTTSKKNLSNVLILSIRLSDSVIVHSVRTDIEGKFDIKLPLDTFQILFLHPDFGEKFYFIIGNKDNKELDFGKIILPPKEYQLDEIAIFAYREPVYYKGDTLVYVADSFKVRPDATVEDLLKKLPGIKVDKSGKITIQGKTVDKVLVDGDEFFGTDPTTATRNLQAQQVETIQAYEQKNNDASGTTDKETLQILNIQLKDEAKKGYFGKISAASDAQKFYESQVLFNRFRNKQKISIFGISGNTPNFRLSFSDIDKFGLENEYDFNYLDDFDDDVFFYEYNSEKGIPQLSKGGIYFNDKWKKIKVNSNYTFNQKSLKVVESEKSQYFLMDTSYLTEKNSSQKNTSFNHNVNLRIDADIDSLTSITFSEKFELNQNKSTYLDSIIYISSKDVLFRKTKTENEFSSQGLSSNSRIELNRKFKKKDRTFYMRYNLNYKNNEQDGMLHSNNQYFVTMPALPNYNQQKNGQTNYYTHKIYARFIEPLSKFFKLNLNYEYQYSSGDIKMNSFNPNSNNDFVILDSLYSNSFSPQFFQHLPYAGLEFNYKKITIISGTSLRIIDIQNSNRFNNEKIHYTMNNWLPNTRIIFRPNKTSQVLLSYRTGSAIPDITKLQPLRNNNNPNFIVIGNPNLKPTIEHKLDLSGYTYKPISRNYYWFGINYNYNQQGFANSVYYDSTGRSISQTINVKDNYSLNSYLGLSINLFSGLIEVSPNLSYSTYRNINFVNHIMNKTINESYNGHLRINFNIDKENLSLQFGPSAGMFYSIPKATLNNQSNLPYTNYDYSFYADMNFLKRYFFQTDINYTEYKNYYAGFNQNPLIWNASIGAKVDKHKKLKVSIIANDILNQNISISRNISTNIIRDSKVNIIRRYFLLELVYNINSTKSSSDEDEDE
jgi:hypothetical protein